MATVSQVLRRAQQIANDKSESARVRLAAQEIVETISDFPLNEPMDRSEFVDAFRDIVGVLPPSKLGL